MIIATRLPWTGVLAPGEMFDNMLQVMYFSVYFKGILKIHMKIMISAAHMLGARGHVPSENCFLKKCNLVRFDVSLHTILGPPRLVPLHVICIPTQVRFLA